VGGAELDLYVISTELAERKGFNITFYTGDFGQEDRVPITDNLTLRKFPYLNPKRYPKWHHKLIRRLFCIWVLLGDRSEVFFAEGHGEVWGYIVLIRKFVMRKKTVYRIASDLDIDSLKKKSITVGNLLFAFGFRFADFLIIQSSTQRQMLEAGGRKNFTEIKNAMRDTPAPPDVISRKKTILWVGRCIPLKRPLEFMELARSLPEETFTMIIPGEGDLKNEVLRQADQLANLELIDFVHPRQMQDVYIKAKCLVNTSVAEGFPNSFVQAFMAGTPVVSLDVDPDGIFGKHDIGRCCHGNLSEAEAFIRSLTGERVAALYRNSRAYFEENHDISKVIKQYESLFSSIATR